jgi:hypothetical protein
MNSITKVAGLVLLAAAAGCVPSLHPLYTDQDLAFDPALVGIWADNSRDTWTFAKQDDKTYKLIYKDKDGKTGEFLAHLVNVSSNLFLDLYPVDLKLPQNDYYRAHWMPVHTFLRVWGIEPSLRMAAMSPDGIKRLLEAEPDAVRHEQVDGTILLTAAPKELQAFLLTHLNAKDVFDDPDDLKRVATPPGTNPAPSPEAAH